MHNDVKWVMIHNITAVVGFIILAVIFKHWWIVFFSLLFMQSFKHSHSNSSKEDNEQCPRK